MNCSGALPKASAGWLGNPLMVTVREPAPVDAADGGPVTEGLVTGGPVTEGLVTVGLIAGLVAAELAEGLAVVVGAAVGDLGVPAEQPGSAMRAAQTEPHMGSTRRCDMAASFRRR
jgi:hypothetical protein